MPYIIDPNTLTKTVANLLGSGNYDPDGDATKCNLFLNDLAQQAFSYGGFSKSDSRPMLANEIVDFFRTGADGWTKLYDGPDTDLQAAFQDAQNGANQSVLVVIGLKVNGPHGHVCPVVPGQLINSGQWQSAGLPSMLPTVASAGKKVYAATCLSYAVSAVDYQAGELVIYTRMSPQN